jgi:RNA polymerase sigma factor (sigma-70 family)
MKRLFEILRRSAGRHPEGDAVLLARFCETHDEAAFAELVRRHGPLVWGVCRRGLNRTVDAEDAFQAVFLVLIQRAARLPASPTLGPWLYRTAIWTVQNQRRRMTRRRTVELPTEALPTTEPTTNFELYEWLAELPEKYRTPIVLCHLQGWSRHDAAMQLGLAEGTLSANLHRGLAKLRKRFTTDPTAPLAILAASSLPATLAATTTASSQAFLFAATVSPSVLQLSQGVLRMFWIKKAIASVLVASGLAVSVTGWGLLPGNGAANAQAPAKPMAKDDLEAQIQRAEAEVIKHQFMLKRLKDEQQKSEETIVAHIKKVQSILQDRIVLSFQDSGGWSADFGVTEYIGGKEVMQVGIWKPESFTQLLKHIQADPKAPKVIYVNTQKFNTAMPAATAARDNIRAMMKAIRDSGIDRVTYTGYVPDSVTYQLGGVYKTTLDEKGTGNIKIMGKSVMGEIVEESSKYLEAREITISNVFSEQYLNATRPKASAKE